MEPEDLRAFLKRVERRVDHLAWFVLMQLILTALLFARAFGVEFG